MDAYIFQADLYCASCVDEIKSTLKTPADGVAYDTDDYPAGPYADGGGESDSPAHCGGCGVFLENQLTGDGEEYVKDSVADNSGVSEVLTEWREYYDYLFTA